MHGPGFEAAGQESRRHGEGLRCSAVFATPLAETLLRPCERLNRELEALFLARENDENRNPTPSQTPQEETFESRFNLFRWPEPCVQELRAFVLDSIVQTALRHL